MSAASTHPTAVKAATNLAIQKRAKKSTDGGKTAAMKSLSAGTAAETAEDTEAVAETPVVAPPVRATPPPVMRKPPAVPPPVYVRPVVEEPVEIDVIEELPTIRKVPFDPQLWQWREEGGFVHIKTGELREESEFIDPDEKAHDDSGEWDDPQIGGDDW